MEQESDSKREPLLPVAETAVGTDVPDLAPPSVEQNSGSTVSGAIFNFTNTIVGAGAIGLGGAMASSGGLVSVLAILFFAILTKRSLDLVVDLAVNTAGADGTYEGLADVGLGRKGWIIVSVSKFLYSFGCLVAYLVVMKDNLGPSISSLGRRLGGPHWNASAWWVHDFLESPERFTWFCSLVFLLPLCLLRDMTPLANFSLLSIALMATLTSIVIYLYWANPGDEIRQSSHDFYINWLQIRPGFLESLGTFVFAFVSQHTVHLTYESIRPVDRTVSNFCRVTSWSIGIATTLTLLVGLAVYMSFWQKAGKQSFSSSRCSTFLRCR
jgi:sodium-coupled neutral amino acid transporter 11